MTTTPPRIEAVIASLPAKGCTLRDLKVLFPDVAYLLGEELKAAASKGLVCLDKATDRWLKPPVVTGAPSVVCQHPGCDQAFAPRDTRQRYCAKHATHAWSSWRNHHRDDPDAAKKTLPTDRICRKCRETFEAESPAQAHCRTCRPKKPQKAVAEQAAPDTPEKPQQAAVQVEFEVSTPDANTAAKAIAAQSEAIANLRLKASAQKPAPTSALHTQVGGDHYKTMKIQPVEFAEANRLSAAEFAVVKYICRHRLKGGRQDLQKARHCIDLLEELTYGRAEP